MVDGRGSRRGGVWTQVRAMDETSCGRLIGIKVVCEDGRGRSWAWAS